MRIAAHGTNRGGGRYMQAVAGATCGLRLVPPAAAARATCRLWLALKPNVRQIAGNARSLAYIALHL